MGSEDTKVLVTLFFIVGFIVGYKAKEMRISWLKRKRDRLAAQLRKAQMELDLLGKKE